MNPALAHPLYIALKAALAAMAALVLVELFGIHDRLSATFVAVVCISPTVYTGLRRGLEQIAASALGGAVTWSLTALLPRPAALLVGLFTTIWLCFRVGFARAYLVAAFTVLYGLFIPGESVTRTLEHRLASVAIGVFCAIGINLAISFATYRSLFARRMKIARTQVATAFRALAGLLARPPTTPEEDAALAGLFENVFPLLRALAEELTDAARESRLRGGATRALIEGTLRAAHELLSVAHHGKDAALLQRRERAPFPLAAACAGQLAEAIASHAPCLALPPCEPAALPALQRAAEAYEASRQLQSLDPASR